MTELIFALLSIVILAPVLFFLRWDFTTKGKLLILGFSFTIALIGLASKAVLALWQSYLILLLLVMLTFILGYKKLESVTFIEEVEGNSTDSEKGRQNDLTKNPVDQTAKVTIEKEKNETDALLLTTDLDENDEEIPIPLESLEHEGLSDGTIDRKDASESFVESMESENDVSRFIAEFSTEDRAETDEVIEAEEPDQDHSEVIQPVTIADEPLESPSHHYMAELEQMILEDGEASAASELPAEHPVQESTAGPKLLDLGDSYSFDMEELLNHSTESAPLLSMKEVAAGNERAQAEVEDLLAEQKMLVETIEPDTELEQAHDTQPEQEREAQLEQAHDIDLELEDDTELEQELQQETLQKQLFITMISQIQLAQKFMDPNQYEQMIIEYLHPKLPISEYYTFATLLIQHYISNRQFEKLYPLLDQLEEKVAEYPILLQEIQFFKSLYSKK
ncbi:hypothetical protein JK635_03095 [Neobacillus sp. YIM B02564]|uniref:MFS transporter n=1 Tax=Neobacillus paridis TaxID=2803862 RepID=A0ABS1TIY2_9BACI|nr:hypothetical protein [Neobacillus paridis]MBL4951227.1 hypothetical protein [Neobacillus paridis]